MNILIIVDIPINLARELSIKYPFVNIRTELHSDKYEDHFEWANIVFGNLPADLALKFPNLNWLQIVSSGIDGYLHLIDSNVTVTSAKGVHSEAIAHHVMMMILIFSRNFLNHQAEQRASVWNRKPDHIMSLKNKKLGFIGYGSIGQSFSQAFVMSSNMGRDNYIGHTPKRMVGW